MPFRITLVINAQVARNAIPLSSTHRWRGMPFRITLVINAQVVRNAIPHYACH
ncbi:MAG: hypothetical protein U9Q70_12770 [Chloroflexota bacterium]|nr:hypothetical protein [Chloroflexota bacterium]